MNGPSDLIHRAELQAELELLRKRIRDLESMANDNSKARAPKRPVRIWLPVMLAVLLALGVLGAQNKPDALFIDQNGNVGINQPKPESPLDVNGNALVRGSLQVNGNASVQGQVTGKLDVNGDTTVRGMFSARADIPHRSTKALPPNSGVVAGNSDIYFTNTAHTYTEQGNQSGLAAIENAQNFNALMILGRSTPNGRMIGMWDRVGIGKGDPQTALDVAGEIRGKPWISGPYFWRQGAGSTRMTRTDRSVCFLTQVRGKFMGEGEWVEVVEQNGYWWLSGNSRQIDVQAKARCIGAPDNSW